ncbi:MAG: DsrE family protein [Gammaproteobacteria bacterium]|jgi:intracellular sulfur oxidation DsrE/DsrF family protein|nr:DsrE family protein [Gammaproteobacteria bacterium]MDH3449789.1 DsrE family protein [Gammaproteobacteria bacterium]
MKSIAKLMMAVLIASSFMVAGQVSAGDYYGKQKVVYHINYDNPKQQAGALRNIQNHINAVGAENLDLKVVLHGNGLALLLEPESLSHLQKFKHANADQQMTAKVANLKSQGVAFQVCNNTVKGRKVDVKNDLYDVSDEDIVPSGVAEVAKLQQEGYAYIKP